MLNIEQHSEMWYLGMFFFYLFLSRQKVIKKKQLWPKPLWPVGENPCQPNLVVSVMIHQIECPLKWNQWSYSRATSIGWGGRANGSKGQLYPSPKEVRSIALIWKVQKTRPRLRARIHEWLWTLKHSCTLLKWRPKQKNTDPTMLTFLESRILGLFWMFKTLIYEMVISSSESTVERGPLCLF